jgi:hypothetical protein
MEEKEISKNLAEKVKELKRGKKTMTLRKLLENFGYKQRTEDCATRITELLAERNIILNPSIMKFGDSWELKLDDKVNLLDVTSDYREEQIQEEQIQEKPIQEEQIEFWNYNTETWFNSILLQKEDNNKKKNCTFRNEKEVENKFVLPLLNLLGYNDDDRYDGMSMKASHGSKSKPIIVDFALFNSDNENTHQTLLIVEVKNEGVLSKKTELEEAQQQIKSYAFWTSCHFGLVTDGRIIQVIDCSFGGKENKIIFECTREDLKLKFNDLYRLINKKRLTKFYTSLNK